MTLHDSEVFGFLVLMFVWTVVTLLSLYLWWRFK